MARWHDANNQLQMTWCWEYTEIPERCSALSSDLPFIRLSKQLQLPAALLLPSGWVNATMCATCETESLPFSLPAILQIPTWRYFTTQNRNMGALSRGLFVMGIRGSLKAKLNCPRNFRIDKFYIFVYIFDVPKGQKSGNLGRMCIWI